MMNKYRNPKSINLFAQVVGIESLNDLKYIEQYVNEVKKQNYNLLMKLI